MISRRSLEAATAALTGAFGAAVAVSSLDNGIGWSRAGVDAGTFPFITGLIILAGSLYNLAHGWHACPRHAPMLDRASFGRIGAAAVPAAVYVAVIPLLGMYVASATYLFGTLRCARPRRHRARARHRARDRRRCYLAVFERMFQVALPHGLLGDDAGILGSAAHGKSRSAAAWLHHRHHRCRTSS